jgi:8-oxo-dGTP pyrophosphatase MutT (NUDIX family)
MVHTVHAREPFPSRLKKSIFLAGPTPRGEDGWSWRTDALEYLEELGYDGHVFIPEPADGKWVEHYVRQVEWEEEGLHRADQIVFWVPRDLTGHWYGNPMPGLTTNDEWGVWKASGKIVWGSPEQAEKVSYQKYYANKLGVPQFDTLVSTLKESIRRVGDGATRIGWECMIPLHAWTNREFTSWHVNMTAAGHKIEEARIIWSHWPKPGKMFSFAVQAKIKIAGEDRLSEQEFVFFRPDTSSVVMYGYNNWGEPEVVLVKEFRNAVRNAAGFVYELPGGSPKLGTHQNPLETAVSEVQEEVGIEIEHSRFRPIKSRQVTATLSAHKTTLYAVELTDAEMARLKSDNTVHGVLEDNERTYVEVFPISRIISNGLVDWTTVGMICSAVNF